MDAKADPAPSRRLLVVDYGTTAPPIAEPVVAAAAAVGVSSDHLKREIRAGRLRARMIAGKYMVARVDLQEWFDRQPEVV